MTGNDEDDELRPPSALRVARRALVLAGLSCRGLIEADAGDAGAEQLRISVRDWWDAVGAVDESEADELRILETPLGALEQREALNAGWRSEGLAVLSWALGATPLPAFWQQCAPSEIANTLGFLQPSEETVAAAASLRSAAEIEHWADTYLTVHWRLREFGRGAVPIDFEKFVAECIWGPLTLAELETVNRDLSVDGIAIADWPQEQVQSIASIVRERHQALNWLLGFDVVYSEVSTDT
jgi:hypothetical protein